MAHYRRVLLDAKLRLNASSTTTNEPPAKSSQAGPPALLQAGSSASKEVLGAISTVPSANNTGAAARHHARSAGALRDRQKNWLAAQARDQMQHQAPRRQRRTPRGQSCGGQERSAEDSPRLASSGAKGDEPDQAAGADHRWPGRAPAGGHGVATLPPWIGFQRLKPTCQIRRPMPLGNHYAGQTLRAPPAPWRWAASAGGRRSRATRSNVCAASPTCSVHLYIPRAASPHGSRCSSRGMDR